MLHIDTRTAVFLLIGFLVVWCYVLLAIALL